MFRRRFPSGPASPGAGGAGKIGVESVGVLFERRVFHALLATRDQKEGMAAFTEKCPPEFHHA